MVAWRAVANIRPMPSSESAKAGSSALLQIRDRIVGEGDPIADREPQRIAAEDVEQHGAHHEIRHAHGESADQTARCRHQPAMAGEPRQHAERHPHQERDRRSDASDLDRRGQPPGEFGSHRLLCDQRDAEIALDGTPEPHAELLDDGPVQPVARRDLIAELLRRLGYQDILKATGEGVNRPENEDGNAEQGKARAGKSYQRVPRHCGHERCRSMGGGD